MNIDTNCKQLKIGLIGFGSMGRTHLFSVRAIPFYFDGCGFSATVHGLCTAHFDKTKIVCQEYGLSKAYIDEDDLIGDKEIDIIDICTPNIYHFDTAKKALLAGKHVLCEKPLCVTKEEAAELCSLAKSAGKICGIVFNNRFLSPVLAAKKLIDSGRLGKILSFKGEYLHNSCLDVKKAAGWKQTSLYGGGVMNDLGSHVVDLIYYLCGEFNDILGIPQIAFPERLGIDGSDWITDADEAFYAIATLKNGAKGTITASKLICGANDDLNIEIFGTEGSLKFSLMDTNWLYFYDKNLGANAGYTRIECVERYGGECVFPSVKASQGWLRGHIGSMYSYIKSVASEKHFTPSFEDALHIQKVLDAAYRSSENFRPVEI